jgi:hypothetical protein
MIVEAIILGGAIITVGVFVPSIRFARYIAKLFAIDQQIKIAQAHLDRSLHNSLFPGETNRFDEAIAKAS